MFTPSDPQKCRDATHLIITSSFPQKPESYAGIFILELTRRLVSATVRPLVLSPHFHQSPYYEWLPPVRIFRFPYFFPSHYEKLAYGSGIAFNIRKNPAILLSVPSFLISEFLFSFYLIRKNPISLVHTHWLIPQGLVGSLLHRFLNIPHISTVHGSDMSIIKKYPILHPFCRFIIRNVDFITVNSSYMQRQLIDVVPDSAEKIRIIPMGIDIEKFSPISVKNAKKQWDKGKTILSVGRLVNVKGIVYIINAMPEILSHHPDAILLIIGSGPEYASLVTRTKELHLENKVQFLGIISQDDIPSYYRSADLFILPSINVEGITEALGVVLLEAMSSGCPVIGSNVGGIPDIITDGENGFLVPERDSGAIAEKIVQLLSDEALQEKFRRNGIARVRDNFSWTKITREFIDLYSLIIDS